MNFILELLGTLLIIGISAICQIAFAAPKPQYRYL